MKKTDDFSTAFSARRASAVLALTLVYGASLVVSGLCKRLIGSNGNTRKLLVNCTFHNPNWFFSHIGPLIDSKYGETILVCDEPVEKIDNLSYACPPKLASRVMTRAAAKAFYTFKSGLKSNAGIFIGYHIFPSAVTALICARLLGAKAVYQVTGGQLELEGGGWHAENRLLASLEKPSAWIEKLALCVVRCFDLVVVRGSKAKKFIESSGYKGRVETITGSVEIVAESKPEDKRNIDMIFVGRLTESKRVDRFLKIMEKILQSVPGANAVIIGDGPEKGVLQSQAKEMGLEGHVRFLGQRNDVFDWICKAKVFVLTSRSEGVSIAMLEAMGMSVVPVVTDVGDLRDFITDGISGYVCPEKDLEAMARRIVELLRDTRKRNLMASAAQAVVIDRAEKKGLAKRWRGVLQELAQNNL